MCSQSACPRGERESPFPVIPKNGGLCFPFPNFGNGFFHSLPVPEFREWIFFIPFPFPNFGNGIFSFPSHSRNLGMDFFIPFPFPNFGNGLFQFPSRSRISGKGFFNSLPVPEPSKVIPAHPWNGSDVYHFQFLLSLSARIFALALRHSARSSLHIVPLSQRRH